VEEIIEPYFGSTVFSYGFTEALKDDVLTPWRIGFIPIELRESERLSYEECEDKLTDAGRKLISEFGYDSGNYGRFIAEVGTTAKRTDYWEREVHLAQQYLKAFQGRKRIAATAKGKRLMLASLAPFISNGTRTIVFSEIIESGSDAAQLLRKSGCRAEHISSEDSRDSRKRTLEAFGKGQLAVIVAPKILDEGVDVPAADVGIILAGSKSRRQMIQRMGRILRKAEGKVISTFIILYARHTFEDPRYNSDEAYLSIITENARDITYVNSIDNPIEFRDWWDVAQSPRSGNSNYQYKYTSSVKSNSSTPRPPRDIMQHSSHANQANLPDKRNQSGNDSRMLFKTQIAHTFTEAHTSDARNLCPSCGTIPSTQGLCRCS